MSFFELLLIAVSMSMDAFAVSICKGLSVKKVTPAQCLSVGGWFGGFQGVMPAIGFVLTSLFASLITSVSHWIAFVLLLFIGGNMIRESLDKEVEEVDDSFSFMTMLTLAVATSIDALAMGVTLNLSGANIWIAAPLIAVTTAILYCLVAYFNAVFTAVFTVNIYSPGEDRYHSCIKICRIGIPNYIAFQL